MHNCGACAQRPSPILIRVQPPPAQLRDEDIPALWCGLSLPELADIHHIHLLPQNVLETVWAYFGRAHETYGTSWPIRYH